MQRPAGLPTVVVAPAADVESLVSDVIAPDQERARSQEAFDRLVARGGTVVPDLMVMLGSSDYNEHARWVAARALGRVGGTAALSALRGALSDPLPLVRAAGCSGLMVAGDAAAAGQIGALAASDETLMVRLAAVEAIGALPAEQAVPLLEAAREARGLREGDAQMVRTKASQVLQSIATAAGGGR